MSHKILLILIFLLPAICPGFQKADNVVVIKSESRMMLYARGEVIKAYHVVFGANPEGHKMQEGDERTPEGKYVLDYKKSDSAFYRAIHISYPNSSDRKAARKRGVDPGGAIMIHGQPNGWGRWGFITRMFNWTDGCIAVTNKEMDEIWNAVDVGTPIEILP